MPLCAAVALRKGDSGPGSVLRRGPHAGAVFARRRKHPFEGSRCSRVYYSAGRRCRHRRQVAGTSMLQMSWGLLLVCRVALMLTAVIVAGCRERALDLTSDGGGGDRQECQQDQRERQPSVTGAPKQLHHAPASTCWNQLSKRRTGHGGSRQDIRRILGKGGQTPCLALRWRRTGGARRVQSARLISVKVARCGHE